LLALPALLVLFMLFLDGRETGLQCCMRWCSAAPLSSRCKAAISALMRSICLCRIFQQGRRAALPAPRAHAVSSTLTALSGSCRPLM
jgi:hypothetical protein